MKPRRHKVQCSECNATFNHDYKIQHEKNIHGGKKVSVKNLGAPASPFEAASAKKRKFDEAISAEIITKMDCGNKSTSVEEKNNKEDIVCQPSQSDLNFHHENNEYGDKDCMQYFFPSHISNETENMAHDKNLGIPQTVLPDEISSSTKNTKNNFDEEKSDHVSFGENLIHRSDEDSTPTWTIIMGEVKFLLDKCSETNDAFRNLSEQPIIDEKLSVIELMDYVLFMKENCEKILEDCKVFLDSKNIGNFSVEEELNSREHLISHDPGLRPSELTDNQKNYLIKLGPHQPVLASFPSDGKDRFNPRWYKQFPYLEYSTAKNCAYCFVCFLFPDGVGQEKSEDAWSKTGVKNWGKMRSAGKQKLGKLQTHFSSIAHKSALEKYCNFLIKEHHIDVLLDKTKRLALIENERIHLQNREVVRILLDTLLYKKMKSFDFIISLFFMKNIMYKMKILTETLETPDLNLIDCIAVVETTLTILEHISTNTTDMDNLIRSAESFAVTLNIDPEHDFLIHHRRRLKPKRIEECAENEVNIELKQFYRKEFKAVLDTLCAGLRDNVIAMKTTISPLYSIFQFPLNKENLTSKAIEEAVMMFPLTSRPDVCALQSELEVFFAICKDREKDVTSMDALTNVVVQFKNVLKLVFKMCQLVITAGYGVSTNERAFSQLKIVKGALRTTMADERLNSLMLLKCEADLGNISNLENIVDRWSTLKQRRIRVVK